MKHCEFPATKTSIEEAQKFKLKTLPAHPRYVFLGRYETLSVIIASNMIIEQVECQVQMLKRLRSNWLDYYRHYLDPTLCLFTQNPNHV